MIDIISVKLVMDQLEVVLRERSNMTYTCNPPRPAPDRVWKNIYRAVDGEVKLCEVVPGIHTPQTIQSEKFEFPQEDL